jgi:uncharacterized membrane protein
MNLLKTLFRLLVSCLFWILIASWAVFAFNSIYYLITAGPARVVHWYMHISTAGIHFQWSARKFVIYQIVILAITVWLYFLRRRLHAGSESNPGGNQGTFSGQKFT